MEQLKYMRLMQSLKTQITEGQIKPGEKLPSEHSLSDTYQVSRHTVRKALSLLQNEGLVIPVHGKGTFCCKRPGGKESKNVAVVTTYLDSYIFPSIIEGMDRVFAQEGYSIFLKNTRNSRQMEEKILRELLEKDIDGLIIEPSKSQIFCRHLELYEKLEQCRIPCVFIQGRFQQLIRMPSVLTDDAGGGHEVTKYLISRGCRKILGIFKADDAQGQQRHKGYVKALQEAGIPYDPEKVVWFYTEDRTLQPYQQMLRLAMAYEEQPFDGVVCYNDQIAIEAIRALQETGLSVPGDVSVTGFDDSALAGCGRVPLTTIVHPKEMLGEEAARLLISLIRGTEPKETQLILPSRLVIRESTR